MACLPPEIWDHVIRYIDTVQDVKNLTLVSRHISTIAKCHLWESPCLKEEITSADLSTLSHLPIKDLILNVEFNKCSIHFWYQALYQILTLRSLKALIGSNISLTELRMLALLPITELDLRYAHSIDNDWMDVIACMFNDLKTLRVGEFAQFNQNITDTVLIKLSLLRNLRTLHLVGCVSLTGVGLYALIKLPLVDLDMSHWNADDSILARYNNIHIMEAVGHMVHLQKLNISYNEIQDGEMKHLANLTNLNSLNLCCNKSITAGGLVSILKLPLRELSLRKCNINDSCMEILGRLCRLQKLDVSINPDITCIGMRQLSALLSLTRLNLAGCQKISPYWKSGLQEIGHLPLEELSISSCNANDASVSVLGHMKTLRRLNISDNPLITDRGIYYLSELTNLVCLNINECSRLSSKCLSYLVHVPLRELYLSDTCYDSHIVRNSLTKTIKDLVSYHVGRMTL